MSSRVGFLAVWALLLTATTGYAQVGAGPGRPQGTIVLYGNTLPPPYNLSIRGNSIRVNGLSFSPPSPPSSKTRDLHSLPQTPPSGRFLLEQAAVDLARTKFAEGVPESLVAVAIADYYKTSPLVSAAIVGRAGHTVLIRWSGTNEEEEQIVSPPRVGPNVAQELERELQGARKVLEDGGMLLVGDNYFIKVPPSRVGEVLEQIQAIRHRLPVSNQDRWQRLGLTHDLLSPKALDSLKTE